MDILARREKLRAMTPAWRRISLPWVLLVAAGGGVSLGFAAPELARAMERLLSDPSEITALAAAARGRPARTWPDYAADLAAWVAELGASRR